MKSVFSSRQTWFNQINFALELASESTFAKVEKIITKLYSEVRAKYTNITSLHCSMQVNDEQLSLLNSYTSKIYPPPNLKYIICLFFQNKKIKYIIKYKSNISIFTSDHHIHIIQIIEGNNLAIACLARNFYIFK
jgi:hypothetical protein